MNNFKIIRNVSIAAVLCMSAVTLFYGGRSCCSSIEKFEVTCNDGLDGDGDGLTDCADIRDCCDTPECENEPQCMNIEIGNCDDMIDNDGDNLVDCDDVFDCCDDDNCVFSEQCIEVIILSFIFDVDFRNVSNEFAGMALIGSGEYPDEQSQARQTEEAEEIIALRPGQTGSITLTDVMVGDMFRFGSFFRGQLIETVDCEFTSEFIDSRNPEVIWDGRFLTCNVW